MNFEAIECKVITCYKNWILKTSNKNKLLNNLLILKNSQNKISEETSKIEHYLDSIIKNDLIISWYDLSKKWEF